MSSLIIFEYSTFFSFINSQYIFYYAPEKYFSPMVCIIIFSHS